jgi:hypothetical protein
MLIIDDVLLFPARSLMFIFREIQSAAEQEAANEADSIRIELVELYMMLETGRITEEEFDAKEERLLQVLDDIERAAAEDDEESEDAD